MIMQHILLLLMVLCHTLTAHDNHNKQLSFTESLKKIITANEKHNKKDLATLKKHVEFNAYWINLPFITYLASHKDVAWLANNVMKTNELNAQLQTILNKPEHVAAKYLSSLLPQQQERLNEFKQSLDSHTHRNGWIFGISINCWALIGAAACGLNGYQHTNDAIINIANFCRGAVVIGALWGLPTYYMFKYKDVDWLPTNIERNQEIIDQLIPLLNQLSSKTNNQNHKENA